MIKLIRKLIGDIHYAIIFRDIAMITCLTPVEKRRILSKYAPTHKNFVETGTYLGETTAAMARVYETVHTIEIEENFYQNAKERFLQQKHIHCYYGDSAVVLPKIVDHLDGATVFWLDGHYLGSQINKKVTYDTPILKELKAIFARKNKDDVILIDDARFFCGRKSYPRISVLTQYIKNNSEFIPTIKNDIIRLQHDPEWS